jgi:hypothetical protein
MVSRIIVCALLMAGIAANAAAQSVAGQGVAGQNLATTISISRELAVFSPVRAYALSPDGKVAQARLSALEAQKAVEVAITSAVVVALEGSSAP